MARIHPLFGETTARWQIGAFWLVAAGMVVTAAYAVVETFWG